jgi:hypothetical protein
MPGFWYYNVATLSRVLQEAEAALASALNNLQLAAIKWPTFEQQKQWSHLVQKKETLVEKKFAFVDGKNYKVQKPTCPEIQNAFYNGWLHSTLVTNCLCFGTDGTIVWLKLNCPGSWNDGDMSRNLREKLVDPSLTLQDYGIIADSAFPVSNEMANRIVTPLKEGDLQRSHITTHAGNFFF